ncbi:MAG TPA: hypothetical protein VIC04_08280, partial [Terriglobia bacterium]
MIRLLRLPAAVALSLLLAACGSARPSKFYALEIPATPANPSSTLPVELLVGRITAPQFLRD